VNIVSASPLWPNTESKGGGAGKEKHRQFRKHLSSGPNRFNTSADRYVDGRPGDGR